ncbi:MAG: hypothetical protein HXS44_01200 [Theionarchaea archaeon]|nr:hypothetical protein [Theionarchaea archaeon]
MKLEKRISKVFRLDDEAWMRHANPWSVWTRFTVFPFLVIAFWSRVWLGWFSVIPIITSLIWMYVNPRIFPKPKSTKNWASKGVLGERVWIDRDKIPVPEHHKSLPNLLSAVGGIGSLIVVWGVYKLDIWAVLGGLAIAYLGKLWFVDRMVWIYEDMKDLPEYKEWLY